MNTQESDLLNILVEEPFQSQRLLAERSGHSLGIVNRSLRSLREAGLLDADLRPTAAARCLLEDCRPRRAVILAAGFGMRMAPIGTETPKALLEVRGEVLIERCIRQLHEVGITDITVVVGFLKERFEYLMDEFGVTLAVNGSYALKNNLCSLALVRNRLSNCYVIPCDLWFANNPFRRRELYSWYMVSTQSDWDSGVRVNRKGELVLSPAGSAGNTMVGLAYLTEKDAAPLRARLTELSHDRKYDDAFWESALYEGDRMAVPARLVDADFAVEINTFEQLRELDRGSNHLRSGALDAIAAALSVRPEEITEISVLKKGMTNRSFRFTCRGRHYIMRIPGEGTEALINRRQEAEVYRVLAGKGLCDDPVYLDPDSGYKITAYLEDARCCDPESEEDLRRCMDKLRAFHRMRLSVPHRFELFEQIDFYESLWAGTPSVYRDYARTKAQVLSLRPYLEAHAEPDCLTHIDAVPDNFLFCRGKNGGEELQLTDWEYAGMQDPHVDLAMFCIYSLYDRQQCDRLIDLYFEGACPPETRCKIYCYIAVCGLLWSNWCEYKRSLGVEFGEYALRQYRYAKDYTRLVQEEYPCIKEAQP